MKKLKLSMYWAASCGGCEIALLEIHERILDLLEVAEIVFWPCVLDFKYRDVEAMPDAHIDVCLFNGGIRTAENEEIARLLRRKSKTMVAYGACSMLGGIPGLANLYSREEIFKRVYLTSESTRNPRGTLPQRDTAMGNGTSIALPEFFPEVRALADVVKVEYFVPGCPPAEKQTWAVCQALATGTLPAPGSVIGAGDKSVCDECGLAKKNVKVKAFRRPHEAVPDGSTCLLEQGFVCMGPATRSGCEARCLGANMPCRGCYGPAGGTRDAGSRMIGLLGSLIDAQGEEEIAKVLDQVADPAGSFYRFSLPASILGRSRETQRNRT